MGTKNKINICNAGFLSKRFMWKKTNFGYIKTVLTVSKRIYLTDLKFYKTGNSVSHERCYYLSSQACFYGFWHCRPVT